MKLTETHGDRIMVGAVLLASIAVLFQYNPSVSLWLDETITAWTISRPLSQVGSVVFQYQGQSPLYYWLEWFAIQIAGESELAFRALSILAGFGCLIMIFLITRTYFSRSAAFLATTLALMHGDFIRAWVSARPYALALLAALASIYLFLRWTRSRRLSFLIFSAAMFVAAYYLHYLFLLTAIPIGMILLYDMPNLKRLDFKQIIVVALCFLPLMLPGIPHLQSLSTRAPDYSFAPPVQLINLFRLTFPPEVLILLILSLIVARVIEPFRFEPAAGVKFRMLIVFIGWAFLPGLALYVHGLITGNSLLIGRYFLIACGGLFLIAAWILEHISPSTARIKITLLAALFVVFVPRAWHIENWREARDNISKDAAGSNSYVLLYSGIIEAERVIWLLNQNHAHYLVAPFQFYAINLPTLAIPSDLEGERAQYFSQKVAPAISTAEKVYLVAIRNRKEAVNALQPAVFDNYRESLAALGFTKSQNTLDGLVSVKRFVRSEMGN